MLPLWGGCPMVVTIHDMTFDLFPEVHEPLKRFYFPFMIRRAIKRASRVLAISQSTADDLDQLILGSGSKTVVTHLAARTLGFVKTPALSGESTSNLTVASRSVEQASKSDQIYEANPYEYQAEPYVLFIGTLEPRKNLKRLLQAWKQLPGQTRGEHRLIVAGVKGWMAEQLKAEADDSVRFVGHLSDQELKSYLDGATCFVYPSLYEGFGLPVIEAMAAGIPVLTSNVGATEEIAHGAALLVDPVSVSAIESGLRRLLTEPDLRRKLSEVGRSRSQNFSWARTAELTLEALCFAAKSQR